MRSLRVAARLPRADQLLVAEATIALVVARLRSALPFRVLARKLGGIVGPDIAPDHRALTDDEAEAARAVRWAVCTVAPRLPFRALCLQQAIAARIMLARRGIGSVLHLGVSDRDGPTLAAHAWLDAGGIGMTGYPVDPALREAGRFV